MLDQLMYEVAVDRETLLNKLEFSLDELGFGIKDVAMKKTLDLETSTSCVLQNLKVLSGVKTSNQQIIAIVTPKYNFRAKRH